MTVVRTYDDNEHGAMGGVGSRGRSAGRGDAIQLPRPVSPGDKVRFVSPASTPDREAVLSRARILESWGFSVDFGRHAYAARGYLAGSDEERLADFNEALRDPTVRAIFATRGGKGSYRIADRLDFEA